jgi:hypothetical protein
VRTAPPPPPPPSLLCERVRVGHSRANARAGKLGPDQLDDKARAGGFGAIPSQNIAAAEGGAPKPPSVRSVTAASGPGVQVGEGAPGGAARPVAGWLTDARRAPQT